MKHFDELKASVKEKGYGTALYDYVNGVPVYLSRGIREEFLDADHIQTIIELVQKFEGGEYGSASDHGKPQRPGHEYGRYAVTDYEASEDEDTAIWIHTAEDAIIVYFKFER